MKSVDLAYSGSRQSAFYHISQLNNTILSLILTANAEFRGIYSFVLLHKVCDLWLLERFASHRVLRQNTDLENGINKSF